MSESLSEGQHYDIHLCVVGEELRSSKEVLAVCRSFNVPIKFSRDGSDYVDEDHVVTVFILTNFHGEVHERLQKEKRYILGVPAIKDLALHKLPILVKSRPVYCLALYGCRIAFNGYRDSRAKADVARLLRLIQAMGGSIVKDANMKMTHLISKSSIGEKYNYACTFSLPVLTEDWLQTAWDNRENIGYRAAVKEIEDQYRLPLFAGNVIAFLGFSKSDLEDMTTILLSNGGRVADGCEKGCEDANTTHLVVDENNVDLLPPDLSVHSHCQVVTGDWFWNSIQFQAAASVNMYKWREPGCMSPAANKSVFSPPTPSSGGTSRKRKRQRRAEVINALAADSPAHKRRSSISELGLLSMSGSFLDSSNHNLMLSPEPSSATAGLATVAATAASSSAAVERGAMMERPAFGESDVSLPVPTMPIVKKEVTPRQQVFYELVTTESNYVAILDCVYKIAQEAEDPDQPGGALLDQQEMKIIFSNLDPIRKVHTDMIKKLRELELNWTDESCVGSVILEFSEDLLKAYPPFVNFFERTKSQILESDRKSPRFHAFLKKCERRPECSRQTLTELMIRPVQRLPSMSLLLNDLLKHTKKLSAQQGRDHRDVSLLESAMDKVKTVMTHLNEEKRRTEGQITIFDIYSEIENCPASVVSSHRSFVGRYDFIEVAAEDVLCGKGYELTLFLFTDILLIAKKKTGKMGGMIRSPSNMSIASGHVTLQTKALKFVCLLHLSSIRRVVDILDSPDVESGVVAIVYRQTEDLEKRSERCYTLQLNSESQDEKLTVLRTICRHVANTMCRPDPENLLVRLGAKDMALDASDLIVSSLSRTFSSLYKTKQKVGRAFSFNRTPGKLKRAVSSMISPMANSRSELQSKTLSKASNTPSESLRELRLEYMVRDNEDMTIADMKQPTVKTSCDSDDIPDVGVGDPCKVRTFPRDPFTDPTCPPVSSSELTISSTPKGAGKSTPLSRGLQSCVNLAESPRSSRTQHPRKFTFPSPGKMSVGGGVEVGGLENKDPGFRTPNLCSRPSFRDKFRPRSGTFAAFQRKSSVNQ